MSYCAPELLKEGKLTKAADVYSFAMIMWEMYSGTALFRGMNSSQASSLVNPVRDGSLPVSQLDPSPQCKMICLSASVRKCVQAS